MPSKSKSANEIEIRHFVLSEIRFRKIIHSDKAHIIKLLNKAEEALIYFFRDHAIFINSICFSIECKIF